VQEALRARLLELMHQGTLQLEAVLGSYEAAVQQAGRMGFEPLRAMLEAGCGVQLDGSFQPLAEGTDTCFRQELVTLLECVPSSCQGRPPCRMQASMASKH
jgi:hypothetical protein